MAHIGVASAAYWGDVLPFAPVAEELARRGHRVTFAVPDGFHDVLAGHAFELVHLGTDFSPRELADHGDIMERADTIRGMRAALDLWVRRLSIDPAERILGVLRDVDADLWFVHATMAWLAELHTAPAGLPLVVGHLFPMMIPSASQPPPMLPLPGRGGPRLNRIAWRLGRAMTGRLMYDTRINELRRARGLPPGTAHVAFAYERADAVLVLSSAAYWPPPSDWPARVSQTGFTVWEGAAHAVPDDVAAYLDAGPPPVLMTLGTSAATNARDAFELGLEAIREAGERPLLLVGNERNLSALGDRDGVWTFAPLPPVVPRCRTVVHAAGHGTTAACLHAGVPQVVLPQTFDQVAHAERLTQLGVGVTVPWRRRSVQRLASALEAANLAAYRDRAAGVARRLADEDGAVAAADAIEETLTTRRGSADPGRAVDGGRGGASAWSGRGGRRAGGREAP